jgi:L-fuculose-phosphate aldolase
MLTAAHAEPIALDDPRLYAMRAKVAMLGRMMFGRWLTDAAGGNISSRIGDKVCISPRYSGSRHQWQLDAENVLVADLDANILLGSGEISREAKVHFRLHREFGDVGTGVIHAHARNVLVFAAQARPIPPVLEATRKFGEIPVTAYAPAHSEHLAEYIANAIAPSRARISKQAAAALAPYHGLFCIGKDIDAAFDAVERIDTNAYCILMGALLGQSDGLASARAEMENAIAGYDAAPKS